jgi:Family of unknown function (DUF5989)
VGPVFGKDHAQTIRGAAVLSIVAELWSFLRVRKKYWLVPVVVMLGLMGGLVVLTKGSAVAPFIYTLF